MDVCLANVRMYVCVYVCVNICMYASMHVCMYIYECMYVCVYVCVQVRWIRQWLCVWHMYICNVSRICVYTILKQTDFWNVSDIWTYAHRSSMCMYVACVCMQMCLEYACMEFMQ